MINLLKNDYTYIYGLCDPDTERVRYIGQSIYPEERYKEHLKSKNKGWGVSAWIAALRACEKKPLLILVDCVRKPVSLRKEELWIRHYRNLYGVALLNIQRYDSKEEKQARTEKQKRLEEIEHLTRYIQLLQTRLASLKAEEGIK